MGAAKRWDSKRVAIAKEDDGKTITKDGNRDIDSNRDKEPKTAPVALELPEWIDRKALDRFLAMRKKNRKPVTAEAIPLLVRKLESLRRVGNDPTAVLDQSTMNGWQGLFEVKGDADGSNQQNQAGRVSPAEQRRSVTLDSSRAAFGRRYGGRDSAPMDGDGGGVPEPSTPTSDAGHVVGEVGRNDPPIRGEPVSGCVIEGR